MNKLKDMKLLVRVVEEGNFAKASKSVGLTPAMVGRRIAAMETELGFMLFNRSTRRMELTPGGQAYYQGCLRILEEVEELEDSVTSLHQSNPRGLIRLSAPDGLGSPFLLNAIREFRQSWPDVRFDINLSSTPQDLIKEHIDLSLRLAFELDDSSMVASPLGDTSFGLYASPEYLKQNGTPASVEDLRQHDCLHMGSSKYGDVWTYISDGKHISFRHPWTLILPNTECLLQAVASGMGIAMIPDIFAQDRADTGELVRLDNIMEFPRLSLYAMYPTRKHLPYRVRLFLDFLKQRASGQI